MESISYKEKLLVGQSIHEVEVRPITIIVKSSELAGEIHSLERVEITPEISVYHGERVKILHPKTLKLAKLVLNKEQLEQPSPMRSHVIGLIDLTLKFQSLGAGVMWKHPETYLHPKAQLSLADVLIALTQENE